MCSLINSCVRELTTEELEAAKPTQRKPRRQSNVTLASGFSLRDTGVYWVPNDPDSSSSEIWLCSPLEVVAETEQEDGNGCGYLLSFEDRRGRRKQWAMPASMLAGNGQAYREALHDMGARVDTSTRARNLLSKYIQSEKPKRLVRCVSKPGWHGDAFVMPDRTFSKGNEEIIFQANYADHAFNEAGTLAEWQEHLGKKCVGNSRMTFAVSVAFAAPLLKICGEENGGFHFRGGSATGKTTILDTGGSVWGGGASGYRREWRSTDNGLEKVAEIHNDALLVLDEIGQGDGKTASKALYMLFNGMGKIRQGKSGELRKMTTFRGLTLSAGELSPADLMQKDGEKIRGGQAVRLPDIPIHAGQGMNAWENLHGEGSIDTFCRNLKEMAKRFYGTPIRAYLGKLAQEDHEAIKRGSQNFRENFLTQNVPLGASGEVSRVAGRFALVAFAGELATDWGILPWPEGEATKAAVACFLAWLGARGGNGAMDIETGIAQVRGFIEAHGEGRFTHLHAGMEPEDAKTINRVGFRRQEDAEETAYLILPEAFKNEVCKGFNAQLIAKALRDRGHLLTDNDGRLTKKARLPGLGNKGVYWLRSSVLESE